MAGIYGTTSDAVNTQENNWEDLNEKQRMIAQGNNTYWLNKPLQNAFAHKHTLSLEGGSTEGLRFSLNLTYDNNPGVMKESGRDRYDAKFQVQYTYKDKLVVRNSMTYSNVISDNSPYGSFSDYATINPYYSIYDTDGKMLYMLDNDINKTNPLWNTQYDCIDRSTYNQFVNNLSIDWRIKTNLRFKGNLSISQKDTNTTEFKPAGHTDFSSWEPDTENYFRRGSYSTKDGNSFSYDASATLSYFKYWGDHNINAVLSANITESNSYTYGFIVEGFPDDTMDALSFALQYMQDTKATSSDSVSRMIGLVANVNYGYKERYLLDFSYRSDASSKFGSNCQWAPFWAVGLAWNLDREEFIKSLEVVNRLKLRGSIGPTGSQNFDPYQAMSSYKYNTSLRYRYGIGATLSSYGNEDLEWQSNLKTNVGLDLQMFDHKLALTLDAYIEKTDGLLSTIELPEHLGVGSYLDNLGKIENKGIEATLRYTVLKTKDSYLTVSLSGAKNKNTLIELSDDLLAWNEEQNELETTETKVLYIEGESIYTIWGVQSLGINPTDGKEIYLTADGKQTDVWDATDQVPIGVDEPDLTGTIGLLGSYKRFNASIYMGYRLGGQTYNYTLVDRVENASKYSNCDIRVFEETWQEVGDVTFFKNVASDEYTGATSRFVTDYNYLSMSSVSLTYDFAKEKIKKYGLTSLRLGLSTNDLFFLSNVKQERGLSYPYARTVKGTVRLAF